MVSVTWSPAERSFLAATKSSRESMALSFKPTITSSGWSPLAAASDVSSTAVMTTPLGMWKNNWVLMPSVSPWMPMAGRPDT